MYKILKDNKTIQSEKPGVYGGYKVDKIFGTLTCKSGMRMKKQNRVFFHSLEDAVKQGYRPCKNCKPIDQKDFEKIKHLVPEKTLEEFYNRGKKFVKKFETFINTHESVNEYDPYNEEDWNDGKTCIHCHNEEGTYCANPYILEIKGLVRREYICDSCYRDLCNDI